MIPENPVRNLTDLTEREREVLGLFCDGLDYKTIGEKLVIAVPTVKTHMGNIYLKLDLIEFPPPQRRKALFEVYCPALKEVELPPGPDEGEELEPIPPEVEKAVEEDEKAIVLWQPKEIEVIPRPPPRLGRQRPLRWMLVGMLLGALLIASLFVQFGGSRIGTEREGEATQGLLVREAAEVTVVITTTPAPSQPTSTPEIQEVVVVVTATPPPATRTPVATATSEPSALFEDTFDAGLSDAWQRGYGNAIVVNDMLTADQETWLYVGDASWRDYVIEFEADASSCTFSYGSNVVAVRYRDTDNMIAFMWADCESVWYVVEDGSWSEVPNSRAKPGYGMLRLTIRVEGDRFTAHVDGQRLSSFYDDRFQQGRVGLKLAEDTLVDNFRVEAIDGK